MAYTAPRTWVTSEIVTSTIMNAHIRDNLLAIAPAGKIEFFIRAGTAAETLINGAWLEANGIAVSRSTYSGLYTVMTGLARSYTGSTTLAAAITTTGQTAVTLTAWPAAWPTDGRPFLIQVDSEKMVVTAGYGTVNITVTRAAEGTTAATHSNGAAVTSPNDLPFGCGDGATTFNLPDLSGGRVLAQHTSGGHADLSILGLTENVTKTNRRLKHKHGVLADPGHTHGLANNATGSGSGSTGVLGTNTATQTQSGTVGALTVGAAATDPSDAPAYEVAGVYAVKT
jgi:hypothetical protein